jgi:exosortase A-associated hydrolase 2
MNAPTFSMPSAEPFFAPADPGMRFYLFHAPDPRVPPRGAVLYLHPLGDEMHKSRRMAFLQSRALAAAGFGVLQFDFFGCGDSCGEFSAARWPIWKSDIQFARALLQERVPGPIYLWGLRLGALLALEASSASACDGVILWQPFLSGRTCINQFLRLRLAGRVMDDTQLASTAMLRAQLFTRGGMEVGGFHLSADLAHSIDALDAHHMDPRTAEVHWFATGGMSAAATAGSAERLARFWNTAEVRFHHVAGPPFWSSPTAHEAPALLQATGAIFAEDTA